MDGWLRSSQVTRSRVWPKATAWSRGAENSSARSRAGERGRSVCRSRVSFFPSVSAAPPDWIIPSFAPSSVPRRGARSVPARPIKSRTSWAGGSAVPGPERLRERNAAHKLLVDVVAGSVMRSGIGQAQRLGEWQRNPHQVCAFGSRPGPGQRFREQVRRQKHRPGDRLCRVCRAAFLHQMVGSVHDKMPRAAVPVVEPGETQDAGACHIQCHVLILRRLKEKMAGIRAFIAAAPIISAPHIRPHPDPLTGPALPLPVRIQPDGNSRRLIGHFGHALPKRGRKSERGCEQAGGKKKSREFGHGFVVKNMPARRLRDGHDCRGYVPKASSAECRYCLSLAECRGELTAA